jgi:hypothetical protein
MLEEGLGSILFSILGRIYLYSFFRSHKKVKEVLAAKYDNSFSTAGGLLTYLGAAWLFLIAIGICFLAVVYSILEKLSTSLIVHFLIYMSS